MTQATYQTTFAAYREHMRVAMEAAAKPFPGAVVEEIEGDESGFCFDVERADGKTLHIDLMLVDGEDEGVDSAAFGNFAVRNAVLDDGEQVPGITYGPHNFTDRCWAAFDDDAAWAEKWEMTAEQLARLPALLANWQAEAAPTP